MAIIVAMGPVRLALLGAYTVLSVVSFAMYGVDKAAAGRGMRRISEATFHLVSLGGGWPGALAGQHVFRHKTRKQPFRSIFWCTVIANGAAVTWSLLAMPTMPG